MSFTRIPVVLLLVVSICFPQAIQRVLSYPVHTRGWGMNNVASTFTSEITGLYLNPAVIVGAPRGVSFSYTRFLLDIGGTDVVIADRIGNNSNVALAMKLINYGNFEGYDQAGVYTGDYTARELLYNLSWASGIGGKLFYGASIIYFSSRIETYSHNSLFIRVGVILYEPSNTLAFGISYLGHLFHKEEWPGILVIGISKNLAHLPLRLSGELEYSGAFYRAIKVGGEFKLSEKFFLQWGTSTNRFSISTFQTLTSFFGGSSVGLSLKKKGYTLSVAAFSLGEMGYLLSTGVDLRI